MKRSGSLRVATDTAVCRCNCPYWCMAYVVQLDAQLFIPMSVYGAATDVHGV